jgi:signal transduction histidine kinase
MSSRCVMDRESESSQRLEATSRVAETLAHDLNHLLTSVLLRAHLARQERHSPALVAEHLQVLELTTLRAAEVVKQLSAFTGPPRSAPQPLELDAEIREQAGLLMRLLGDEVELVLELPGEGTPVPLSRAEVTQILVNLAVNARDAMPDGGKLLVETSSGSSEGDAVTVLRVSDTGVGIPPEVQERIFEPFFTTKPDPCVSGLGLSNVRAMVERARGHVLVHSAPGHGTTFELRFPVSAEP